MRSADEPRCLQEGHASLETDEEWQAAEDQIQEERQAAENQVLKELGHTIELVEIDEAVTFEGLEEELGVKERLDATIAKYVKRLMLAKGFKSVLAVSSSESPKLITGP